MDSTLTSNVWLVEWLSVNLRNVNWNTFRQKKNDECDFAEVRWPCWKCQTFSLGRLYFHRISDEKLAMNIHRARSRATNSLNFNHGRTLSRRPLHVAAAMHKGALQMLRAERERAKVFYSWPAYITIGNLQRKRGFGGSVNLGKKLRIRDRCKSRELLDFRPTCFAADRYASDIVYLWSVLYSCIF